MKILSISEEKKQYSTKEEVAGLLAKIEENKEELVEVDLTENSFSPDCLLEVLQAISQIESIEVLIFKGIFTQKTKEEVVQSLRHIVEHVKLLPNVSYFDMSDNALSLHGMNILAELIEGMQSLKHLVLNNNGIGRDGGEFLSQCLTTLSGRSSKLLSIEAGRNRLEDSAEKLAKSLELFPYLESVKLYQNSIGSVAIGEVLNSLYKLDIRVLDLADNFLLEHGATVLSKCLSKWNLDILDVSDCLIRDEGFEILAEKITDKVRMQGELVGERVFNLSYNDFTSKSLSDTKAFLEKFPSIQIHFTGNMFTEEDIAELMATAEEVGSDLVIEEEEMLFSEEEEEEEEEEILEKEKEKEKDLTSITSIEEKLADLTLKSTHEVS
ncbi:Ran GTPase-activating protein 1 [Nematocida sp. AWRm77]|nr:Ran GTPase-activating protein 1 [Nematocida sp. AWRm77]